MSRAMGENGDGAWYRNSLLMGNSCFVNKISGSAGILWNLFSINWPPYAGKWTETLFYCKFGDPRIWFSGVGGIFTFFLNFIKYFLNKLTPYTQENVLQLFSILNLAIHGYDFRGWGRIFYFFFILSLVFGETDIVTLCIYSILEGIVGCGVGMTTYESNPCFILWT